MKPSVRVKGPDGSTIDHVKKETESPSNIAIVFKPGHVGTCE